MSLWAHTLVKNEDRYIWYAVKSVIPFVDKILIWDTGSTDNTLKIIGELIIQYSSKIDFRQMGEVSPEQFTVVRQKMLDESRCDWLIIVDGDEVWWRDSIKNIRRLADLKNNYDSIVSRYYNIVGDMYHFRDESTSRYSIDGIMGNFNIRLINRNIKGLKFTKPHGQQGIVDSQNVLIQDRDPKKRLWTENYSYLHFTNMQRSGVRKNDLRVPKRDFKLKYEVGIEFPMDYYYPEVFFEDKPDIVGDVWRPMNSTFRYKSTVSMPLKYIKRRLFDSKRSGY